MLTSNQVRPFLSHDDELVRERALVYFAEAANSSLLQADDLWTVVDRFGPRNSLYRALANTSPTSTSTERLIEAFVKYRDNPDRQVIEQVILSLPLEFLETVVAHPVAGLMLSKTLSRGIERRRQFAATSVDALWNELIAFAEHLDSESTRESPYRDGSIVVDELAKHPGEVEVRALELISSPKTADSWLEVYLIDLVGTLRVQDAIPFLFNAVGQDGDLVNEHAADALGKIGTAELAAEIADRYAEATDDFQRYTPSALASMRSPAGETALVRVLDITSNDPDRNTFVADDLCDMCTTVAFPTLLDKIERGQFEPGITPLDEHVLALALMQGIEVPWADECRRKRQAMQQRVATRLAALTGIAPGHESTNYVQPASKVTERRVWVPTSKKRKALRRKKRH